MNQRIEMSRPAQAWLPGLAVAVAVVAAASSFPFIRMGLQGLPPLELAAARFGVAALLLLPWLAWRRPELPGFMDGVRFLLCGVLGVALFHVLLNTGELTVQAGAASFIVNTMPIMTALLSAVFLRETLPLWGWLGSLCSLGGVALIAQGQPGGLGLVAGSSLILGAALSCALFVVLQKSLVARYGVLPSTAYTLLAGAACLSPWWPEALVALSPADARTVFAVAWLGVFPSVIGYACWNYALDCFGAVKAANFLYLVPVVASSLSVFVLDESIGILTLAGGALVVAGVMIVNLWGPN
ncbi:MAG: DMT family transporter [Acidovorax sp.]|jgi:drug/metabolite transporter (DMT)-like permease|nr:DMT family transporter [Acidovorax sp.]